MAKRSPDSTVDKRHKTRLGRDSRRKRLKPLVQRTAQLLDFKLPHHAED